MKLPRHNPEPRVCHVCDTPLGDDYHDDHSAGCGGSCCACDAPSCPSCCGICQRETVA